MEVYGTNYAPIIAAQTITNNGTLFIVFDRPVKFVKAVFVSEWWNCCSII